MRLMLDDAQARAARSAVGRAAFRQPRCARDRSMPSRSSWNSPRRTPTRRCSSRCASRSTTGRRRFGSCWSTASRNSSRRCSTSRRGLSPAADRPRRRRVCDALYDKLAPGRTSARRGVPADARPRARRRRRFCIGSKSRRPGAGQGPVSDWELASRLSYFLWSSQPDAELRQAAADGRLHEPDVLARANAADAARRQDAAAGDRVRLPVAAHPRLRASRRKERAALPDVRELARRDVRGIDPVLHRPVSARRLGAGYPRRRLHVPERAAGASTTAFPA